MTAIVYPIVHFPAQDVIVNYLGQHPLLQHESLTPYLNNEVIFRIIANLLADQQKSELKMSADVMITLYGLSDEFDLPDGVLNRLVSSITRAMSDCVHNVPVFLAQRTYAQL